MRWLHPTLCGFHSTNWPEQGACPRRKPMCSWVCLDGSCHKPGVLCSQPRAKVSCHHNTAEHVCPHRTPTEPELWRTHTHRLLLRAAAFLKRGTYAPRGE
eukprot:7986361-Alexandrium_andersonii.AAC.1